MKTATQSKIGSLFAVGACTLALSACQPATSNEYTFPEGNALAGQTTFVELGCVSCHSVTGVPALRDGMDRAERTIALGGERTEVVSYGQLVTAIVNPSHEVSQTRLGTMVQRDGETLMRNYNDLMTVTQLTDLVTFLEQHYTLKPFDRTDYRSYAPLQ